LKLLFLLLATIVIIESCSRLIYRFANRFPQIQGGVQFVEYLRGKDENFTGPIETRPYGLYWNRPNYFRKGFRQTDSNGFRYKGYDISLTKSKMRILCYGGSTTYSDHVLKNPDECWPHLLESKLRQSNLDAEIINCGLNYGMTSELLSHLIFEGVHFNPDYVILHGPGNDMLPIAVGDTSFDYRNTRRSLNLEPRFFEPLLLKISGVARIFYARALRENELVNLEPNDWPVPEVQNKRLMSSQQYSFQSNVRCFVDICLARGIKVILVNFVQNHREQLEKMRPGMSAGMVQAVENMNSYFKSISKEKVNSVFLVDIDSGDFKSTDFVDICHLNIEGENRKAQLICQRVLAIIQ
jgi:hypothetical protein